MNFQDILADIYRRCGYATSPDAAVVTRIKAFVNETQHEILSAPGAESIFNDIYSFALAQTGRAIISIPAHFARIKTLRDVTNGIKLQPISLGDWRALLARATSREVGLPTHYVDLGVDATRKDLDSNSITNFQIAVKSTDATDAGKVAYIEGYDFQGLPLSGSVSITGTSYVDFSITPARITKFYLSAAAAGTVVLTDASAATATVTNQIASIPSGYGASRTRKIALWPTPNSTGQSYQIDAERQLTDLVNPYDEPQLPLKFHRLLAIGARAKEYEKLNQVDKWQLARAEYKQGFAAFRLWLNQDAYGSPNLRDWRGRSASRFNHPYSPTAATS